MHLHQDLLLVCMRRYFERHASERNWFGLSILIHCILALALDIKRSSFSLIIILDKGFAALCSRKASPPCTAWASRFQAIGWIELLARPNAPRSNVSGSPRSTHAERAASCLQFIHHFRSNQIADPAHSAAQASCRPMRKGAGEFDGVCVRA